jgi:hypothetical protein
VFNLDDRKYILRKSLLVDGYEDHLKWARYLKQSYDKEIRNLQRQFGIQTEHEVVTCVVLRWNKQYKRHEYESKGKLRDIVQEIRRSFVRDFNEKANITEENPKRNTLLAMQIAAACYWVCYNEEEPSSGELSTSISSRQKKKTEQRLRSFVWVVAHDVMIAIHQLAIDKVKQAQV